MALLSTLKNRLSSVFSSSQSDSGDADVEQTQATDGSAYSDVASSQTVVEGPPAARRTISAADVGELQNPEPNSAVAGQLKIAGNAEARPVIVTQFYDDEEWASNLSGEDIEAGTPPVIIRPLARTDHLFSVLIFWFVTPPHRVLVSLRDPDSMEATSGATGERNPNPNQGAPTCGRSAERTFILFEFKRA